MEKRTESKRDTQPHSSAAAKKTRAGKNAAFGCSFRCSNTFYDSEGTATGIHFYEFLSLSSEINRRYNLIKRQNKKKMGFIFPLILFCVTTISLRWKLLPRSIL